MFQTTTFLSGTRVFCASKTAIGIYGNEKIAFIKETIDTVKHAAQRIGCSEAEIAKTLSFIVDEKPVIVVIAGDGRVNPSEFKAVFHTKPSMIQREQIEAITGFASSGVCPFNVPKEIPVWLDVSMKRFEYVHPADGNKVSGGFLFEIHFLLENFGAHSTCE
ncbi:MAG: YbaK/EbsC family protein [Spirochaetaceae bacterium]|nr:YbaK/EbsC family protein [Spirochaetaceae bacterium]